MSDLISREALLQAVKEDGALLFRDASGFSEWMYQSNVITLITNAPAIEQGEVVGYGVKLPTGMYGNMYTMKHEAKDDFANWKHIYPESKVIPLYATPQQPQSVADALEEAAKICDRYHWIPYANPYDCAKEIRALIKRNVEPKACKWCNGQGYTETGIDESPTTICNNCDGIGTITPKEGE